MKSMITRYSLIALCGHLISAISLAASNCRLERLSLGNPCRQSFAANGRALLPTLYSIGQKLKRSMATALSRISALCLSALLTIGNCRNLLPPNITSLRASHYYAQQTATLPQATSVTWSGLLKRIDCSKRPQVYTSMLK